MHVKNIIMRCNTKRDNANVECQYSLEFSFYDLADDLNYKHDMYKTCSYIKYGLVRVIIKYLRSYMVGIIINNNIIFLELFSL